MRNENSVLVVLLKKEEAMGVELALDNGNG